MEKSISLLRKILTKIYYEMAYKIDADLCSSCGTCQSECPQEAIAEGTPYVIDPDLCVDCGACADVCPCEAIHPE